MQPDTHTNFLIRRIAAKEMTLFFASPIAYLFLATFAGVTLFVFFWGASFFSRNIADVRPMFTWMPVLLIFLASTLTMRLWSEEKRTGTLEHLLTQPAPLWCFVLGKFLGCLALLGIALAMTLPIPLTVSWMGSLDWGPVWAGYLATFLLGAAYLSIGLFVSARCQNQIVSLISACALCSLFYLIGSTTITDLFGYQMSHWLKLLGTGSRFESITRGMIDVRDLYYYISLIVVFLTLNTWSLEKQRWAKRKTSKHHQLWQGVTALLLVNAILANIWLASINTLRVDTTEGKLYSISDATKGYLLQLQEPLLLRGYFSNKTHPLLAPLVPQLQDLMREYEIAGKGKIKVEFVDPAQDSELEQEANQKYGISPVPFQVADRYQSAIVSSYFNVLVQYGDEYQVLGFRDLIEVHALNEDQFDIQLRNPEHDLTRSVKKVIHHYQAAGNIFDTVEGNINFHAYVSNDAKLPEQLSAFRQTVSNVVQEVQQTAKGRLSVEFLDPDANGGEIAGKIVNDFGFTPMSTSLLSEERFYFYLTLTKGKQVIQIPLDDLSEQSFKRNLTAGIKRFATGFTKTVALVVPENDPTYGQYGFGGPQFSQLEQFLGKDLNVLPDDLSQGKVSGEADILLLMAPEHFTPKQLFAVDQFLMQGGTVIVATSPYNASFDNRNLNLQPYRSGLEDWLAHHGFRVENKLVLDPQNTALPIPVTRNVGGFQLQEIQMLDYPYFIDVRGQGLNADHAISADIPQATLPWASPITLDSEKQKNQQVTRLMHSSDQAWLSENTDIMPQVDKTGMSTFTPQGTRQSYLLGAMSEGVFHSYFSGQNSPLLADETSTSTPSDTDESSHLQLGHVIQHSSDVARLILFSSNSFLQDQILQFAGAANHGEYLNTLQLIANSVDWSLEDKGLLSIRSRSHFNRTLAPMAHSTQLFWEYLNYGLAALALCLIALIQRQRHKAKKQAYQSLLAE